MLQPIVNLLKPNQTRKQTRSAARGGGVACVRLELAGHLVLEGIELLDELGAGVLVEHVPVHEPGRVSEADELHHLGKDGDGVDGADDGAGEPHERRAAGDVGDHRGLVLGVLPLLIDGDDTVSERKAEGWRRWFRLFFSRGGVPKLGGSRSGACGTWAARRTLSAMVLRTSSVLILESATALVETARLTANCECGDAMVGRWAIGQREDGDLFGWWFGREGKEMFRPRRDHALVAGIHRANGIPSPGIITAKVPAKHSRRVRRVHTLAARGTARSRSAFRGANLLNIAEINDAGRMCFGTHLGLRELGALEGGGLEGAGGAGLGGHDAGGEDSGGGDDGGHVS
jgi:hypothetical protein